MVRRWATTVADRARLVLIVGAVLVAAAGAYGLGVFGSLSSGGFDDPDSESARQVALEKDLFDSRSPDVVVVLAAPEDRADLAVTDPAFEEEVRAVVAGLPEDAVASTTTVYDTGDRGLVSQDGTATQVVLSLSGESQDEQAERYDEVAATLDSDLLDVSVAGPWAVFDDVETTVSEDLARAEKYALPIILVLSLLIFGSLVAALMPVMVGAIAVVGALAVVRLLTGVTEVSVFSINVITLLGMGLAIDYALFVISRFREELGMVPDDDPDAGRTAIMRTMATAGRTVLFSGLTVAAALSSLLVFPQGFLRSMGWGGMAAVLVAMLAALTVLPAVLRLLGRRVDGGRLPWRRHRPVAVDSDHGAWAGIAHSVMRRPVTYLLGTTALLLAVASPFLGVQWGGVDYRVLPEETDARAAAELINEEFGPETSSANIVVTGAGRAEVSSYVERLQDVAGISAVQPIAQQDSGDGVLLRVAWAGNSQSATSQDTVRELRAVAPPDGAEALVGGLAAGTVDLLSSIGAHLPWMAAIVVGVMLVLLFLAFGSLVLPLKAVAMNALSITASFGVVTWVFSDGHLEGLLDFESTGFLDATQPILMLAILFGLSMDYEVFLLSRVREQWDRTGDNTLAVTTGVQKTGRIITSAALLLAVVIGAFSTSGIVFMKLIGVGMLVALLLDATVVRALLVPATMKLLGAWNWWAPGPLRRWWERHGFREEGAGPPPPTPGPSGPKHLARLG